MEYDYLFKLFILGDGGVGKLGLIRRLKGNIFDAEKTLAERLGLAFYVSMVNIEGKPIKLHIFCFGGPNRINRFRPNYSEGLVGVLLVYDITRRETFNYIPTLMKVTGHPNYPNVTYMLVGNKCELENERVVSKEEAEQFAQQNGLLFVETSAATSQNVEEAFNRPAANALKKIQDGLLIHKPSKPQQRRRPPQQNPAPLHIVVYPLSFLLLLLLFLLPFSFSFSFSSVFRH